MKTFVYYSDFMKVEFPAIAMLLVCLLCFCFQNNSEKNSDQSIFQVLYSAFVKLFSICPHCIWRNASYFTNEFMP